MRRRAQRCISGSPQHSKLGVLGSLQAGRRRGGVWRADLAAPLCVGAQVEAKRALPKDESPVSKDQQAVANGQRTKKIFVGGLPPSVDDETFRNYFGEFGEVGAWDAGLCAVGRWRNVPLLVQRSLRLGIADGQGFGGGSGRGKGSSLLYCGASLCFRAGRAARLPGASPRADWSALSPSLTRASLRYWAVALGQVDDAVVMYDHENKRPRGFGFITFTGRWGSLAGRKGAGLAGILCWGHEGLSWGLGG